jgi:hypothetical protein
MIKNIREYLKFARWSDAWIIAFGIFDAIMAVTYWRSERWFLLAFYLVLVSLQFSCFVVILRMRKKTADLRAHWDEEFRKIEEAQSRYRKSMVKKGNK